MNLEKRPRIISFYSDEELWAMKEDLESLRAELSATKQELAQAQEKLTKAYRVRDELDRQIQSIIPTLTAEIRRLT